MMSWDSNYCYTPQYVRRRRRRRGSRSRTSLDTLQSYLPKSVWGRRRRSRSYLYERSVHKDRQRVSRHLLKEEFPQGWVNTR